MTHTHAKKVKVKGHLVQKSGTGQTEMIVLPPMLMQSVNIPLCSSVLSVFQFYNHINLLGTAHACF